MIISRTPFRVSFFGGGTDYPAWFNKHGGAFLSATINRYCYVMVRRLPPFFEVSGRISWSMIENVNEIDDIQNPVVRESLRLLNMKPELDIHYHGDLPARTGLGSSSAFCVGLLNGLHALRGEHLCRMDLAKEAIKVEYELIGDTVGVQDQIATAHGGLNFCTIQPSGEVEVRPVVVSAERQDALQNHMLLFYTGISRSASDIASTKVRNMNERVAELTRIKDLAFEAHGVLCSTAKLEEFGKLLDETWRMKRSLSNMVSNDNIDQAYTAAQKAGAIGGKLLGAGGGGFLLIFAPPERHERVRTALKDLLHVPVKLERSGAQIIYHDPEQ